MPADLHSHSVHSDGSATTEQMVDFAWRVGLTHLALTDHDTMMGVPAITALAAAKGITVIPGVECTCTDFTRNRPVHMLCYAPAQPGELQAFLNPTLERRRTAKMEMVQKIRAFYPIREEDVLRLSRDCASIHEVHLIQALADMGYTATVCGPLMEELIGREGSCFVPIAYPDAREVAGVIRDVGGAAVLAHPGQFDSMALAEELCQAGLLHGIECYHPRNDDRMTDQSEALAARYGLIRTGGTDFHGWYAKTPHPLGFCTTAEKDLARLLAWGAAS